MHIERSLKMKSWKKISLWTVGGLAITGTIAAGIIYTQVIKPRADFRAACENSATTPDTLRDAAHHCLAWNVDHDAFLVLQDIGNDTSIPVLIRSLRRIPQEDVKSGMIECTWGHCHDALVALTGEDLGFDPDRWQAWMDKHQSEQDTPPNRP
jgi:hypothetical protein